MKSFIQNYSIQPQNIKQRNGRASCSILIMMLGFVIMFVFIGCYKDKGNYNYHEVNDVNIQTSDTVIAIQGDTLNITPVLKQALAKDESQLKFEWSVKIRTTGVGSDSTNLILSEQRNLSIPVTLYAESDYYAMNYKVTDITTGITYRKQIALMVTTNYRNGWMVLEQANDHTDISFVNTLQSKAYHHVYSDANPETPLPASAHHVYNFQFPQTTYNGQVLPRSILSVVLFADGGYILDNANYKKEANYASLFSTQPAVIQPQHMNMDDSPDMITINAGKLYRRSYSKGQLLFSNVFAAPDNADYVFAPLNAATIYNSNYFIKLYFDTANHRFLAEQYQNSTLYAYSSDGSMEFDPNDVQKKLLAMAKGMAFQFKVHALFKNYDNDDCFLYTFSLLRPGSVVQVLDSPGIHNSPSYAFSTSQDQMYYAADNQIYLYDLVSNSSSVIYSFPAGENISSIQIEGASTLIVSTYNGISGAVYSFLLNSVGEIDGGTYNNQYTGFGKIIHMGYAR